MRALPLLVLLSMSNADANDEATNALTAARTLTAEGKFEQALKKHIWFHDHALETQPSYSGVRLSFALADWVALGKKYPPALVALRQIRDDKTSRLEDGEKIWALFHDVASINRYLKEESATAHLFQKLDTSQPEFAGSVHEIAEESLIAEKEYSLARKYLGDPMIRFGDAQRGYEEGMQWASSEPNHDATRRAFENIFATNIVQIITILTQTNDPELAREIQTKALEVLDSPAIRNAPIP